MVVFLDNDGDGRGNISTREEVCYFLEGYVTLDGDKMMMQVSTPLIDEDGISSCDGDCNDNNSLIYQNATEICNEF